MLVEEIFLFATFSGNMKMNGVLNLDAGNERKESDVDGRLKKSFSRRLSHEE